MMKLTANCQRSGGWWAVDVPEVPGLFTQAKRLDQVAARVRDAATLLTDQPEDSFEVTVAPHLDGVSADVTAVKEARSRLRRAEAEAAVTNRRVAAKLAGQGLTVRDIGTILGVSPQRAHHLLQSA
jgi:DNA-directed RNA polymerase specialized sigma24 family protein